MPYQFVARWARPDASRPAAFTSTKAEPVLGMPIFDRFGPSLNQPVVMSYVSAGVAEMNDKVLAKAITSVYRLSPPTLKDNQ